MPRPEPSSTPRRRFLRTLGAAGLALPLVPLAASLAQTPPPSGGRSSAPADSSRGAAPPPPASTEPSEDAKALAAILRRRHSHLTSEQMQAVTRDFENDLGSGRRLRAVKLVNGDEPDTTFRAEP